MSSFENITYDEHEDKFLNLRTKIIEKLKQIFDLEEYDSVAEYLI